jgi:hypothetical protein
VCVKGIDFTSFYDFDIRFWNCSDSVVFSLFILLINERVLTMYLILYWLQPSYFIKNNHSNLVEFLNVPLHHSAVEFPWWLPFCSIFLFYLYVCIVLFWVFFIFLVSASPIHSNINSHQMEALYFLFSHYHWSSLTFIDRNISLSRLVALNALVITLSRILH